MEDVEAYEDEIYKEQASGESDLESEVEEHLYAQAHYCSQLSISGKTNGSDEENSEKEDGNTFPEILVEEPQQPLLILGTESSKKAKKPVSHAVVGEDIDQWDVDDADLNKSSKPKSKLRYYEDASSLPNIYCHNCDKKGHVMKQCPEPKKSPLCFLCGQSGHQRHYCPNDICYNCKDMGHISKDCPKPQVKPWQLAKLKCYRCHFYGHGKENCPEIWRQYHYTATDEAVVKPYNPKLSNKKRFCYNCASKKHFGEDCNEARFSRRSVYTQFVVNYDECKESKRKSRKLSGKEKEHLNAKITEDVSNKKDYGLRERTQKIQQESDDKEYVSSKRKKDKNKDKQESKKFEEYTKKKKKKKDKDEDCVLNDENQIKSSKDDKKTRKLDSEKPKGGEQIKKSKKELTKSDGNVVTSLITAVKDKFSKKRKRDPEFSVSANLKLDAEHDEYQTSSKKRKVYLKSNDANMFADTLGKQTSHTEQTQIDKFTAQHDFIPISSDRFDVEKTLREMKDQSNEMKKATAKVKNVKKKASKRKEYDLDYQTLHNLQKILDDSDEDKSFCDEETHLKSNRSSPALNIANNVVAEEAYDDYVYLSAEKKDAKESSRNALENHQENQTDFTRYDPNQVYGTDLTVYGIKGCAIGTGKTPKQQNSTIQQNRQANGYSTNQQNMQPDGYSTKQQNWHPGYSTIRRKASQESDVRVIEFNSERRDVFMSPKDRNLRKKFKNFPANQKQVSGYGKSSKPANQKKANKKKKQANGWFQNDSTKKKQKNSPASNNIPPLKKNNPMKAKDKKSKRGFLSHFSSNWL